MITLDSSGVIALLNRHDPNHVAAVEALGASRGPRLAPATIMAEIAYMLESRGHHRLLDELLSTVQHGQVILDCGDQDIARVRALIGRYRDLPLGFADACAIACAERNGGHVLTFDLRHFGTVAREGHITIVPGDAGY